MKERGLTVMPPQQITLDEQRHSELFEGLLSPEEFRKRAKPGKRPPTLRTLYRWMDRGMVAWVQWGVAASLALQFGCPPETLRRALLRDSHGQPSMPLGAALDLFERGVS
jgi:hypothetical protein